MQSLCFGGGEVNARGLEAAFVIDLRPANSPSICISRAAAYLCLLTEQGCCLAIIRHQRIHIGEFSTYSLEGSQGTPNGFSTLWDPWVKDLCAKKERAYSRLA